MLERYKKAEKLLSKFTEKGVLNGDPKIVWEEGDYLCYEREERNGDDIILKKVMVDCITGSKEVKGDVLSRDDDKAKGRQRVTSPDGRYIAFVRDYNLWVEDTQTGDIINLTKDGCRDFDYATSPGCSCHPIKDLLNDEGSTGALWSPDSKKLLTYRIDQRDVKTFTIMRSCDIGHEVRPEVYEYHCQLPGDEAVPVAHLYLCDLEQKTSCQLNTEPVNIVYTGPFNPDYSRAVWMSDSKYAYYTWMSRDFKEAGFNIIDTDSCEVRNIFSERTDTFLNLDTGELDGFGSYAFSNYMTSDMKRIIWSSERDGFSHLYLYDADSGRCIKKITEGRYIVKELVAADDDSETIYFMASNFDDSSDPYYRYFCKIGYDGSDFVRLTDEDADHKISMSLNKKYFADTYSRVDLPPVTLLRKNDGSLIAVLEEADISGLLQLGYVIPQRFKVKASDGVTDLYGIVIPPANKEPGKKYPVIDYIYGGMQCINVPKRFTWKTENGREIFGGLQSLSQLGFAGLILDGLGTPCREKKLHDISYQNIQGCAGLHDHVYCTDELVIKFDFMDKGRFGIWGSSGGGCASARAMLKYPDFYKVAVSSCGNHDQRLYNSCWTERYNGLYSPEVYDSQNNDYLASNLKGKLLLVHGDMDDNVHISNTLRLVHALIEANKDFDMLVMPNEGHNIPANKYFIRKKWDYFVKHLLQETPPKGYQLPL